MTTGFKPLASYRRLEVDRIPSPPACVCGGGGLGAGDKRSVPVSLKTKGAAIPDGDIQRFMPGHEAIGAVERTTCMPASAKRR